MPVKTFPHTIGGVYRTRSKNNGDPNWGPWVQGSASLANVSDSVTTSFNYPNWRYRTGNGISATTPLTGIRRRSHQTGPVNIDIRRELNGLPNIGSQTQAEGEIGWAFLTHPSAPTVSTERANLTALRKWVSRATAVQRKMQGAVFIGEIREAIRMIRNPFQVLYRGQYSHIQSVIAHKWAGLRGRKPTHRRLHQLASDAWLESAFGWRPLLADIDDGISALAHLATKHPPSERVYGKGEERIQTAQTQFRYTLGHATIDAVRASQEEAFVRYHGSVWVDPVDYNPTAHTFGVDLGDLLPAAWELIPWSFLADYFVNIGDIIEAASFNRSAIRWIEKGTKRVSRNLIALNGFPSPPPSGWSNVVNACSCACVLQSEYEERSRGDYTTLSLVPELAFKIPGSSMKWLNIAALLATHDRNRQRYYRI